MTIGRRAFFIFLAFICVIEKTLFILSFGNLDLSLEKKVFDKYAEKRIKNFLAEEKD